MNTVKLGDLPIEWKRGSGLKKSDICEDGKNYCVLYGELFTKHKNVLIDKNSLSKTNKPCSVVSKKGDALVPGTSTAAKEDMILARELNQDGIYIGGDINIIRPKPGLFAEKYLAYFFEADSTYHQLKGYITGTTGIIHISNTGLKNLMIPLPPLHEQQRVVAKLDAAFERIDQAIGLTQRNFESAHKIFENEMYNIFSQSNTSWQQRTLKDISYIFGRGKSKHRPRNDRKLYGGNIPFIQTGDIRNSTHFVTQYKQTYNKTGLAQSKLWPKGTICITIAANIAETGILTFDACFPDSIIGIVVDEKQTSNSYVEYLLQSFKVRLQALGKGSAQDNINLATFENVFFPFPDLREQAKIVQQLDELDAITTKLKRAYHTKLSHLQALKESMLEQAFSDKVEE